jgi:cytochrome P450
MAGLDDFFKGNLLAGLVIGVGAIVMAPIVLPVVAAVSRPLAKSTIKTGVILFEKGREAAAEMTEVIEDLIAEARAELEQSRPPSHLTEMAAAAGAAMHDAEDIDHDDDRHHRHDS